MCTQTAHMRAGEKARWAGATCPRSERGALTASSAARCVFGVPSSSRSAKVVAKLPATAMVHTCSRFTATNAQNASWRSSCAANVRSGGAAERGSASSAAHGATGCTVATATDAQRGAQTGAATTGSCAAAARGAARSSSAAPSSTQPVAASATATAKSWKAPRCARSNTAYDTKTSAAAPSAATSPHLSARSRRGAGRRAAPRARTTACGRARRCRWRGRRRCRSAPAPRTGRVQRRSDARTHPPTRSARRRFAP